MDAVLHSSKEIQKFLAKNFINVSLGCDAPEINSIGVTYIPLMVFYTYKGKEIERKVGSMSEERLLILLKRILNKAKELK